MTKKKVSKRGAALSKPVKISTKLAAVIGKGPMPRTHVTKKIWAYIKKNDLQHPEKKVLIELDGKLKTILKPSKTYRGKDKKTGKVKMLPVPAGHIWMMDMTKQLNKHIESEKVKVNPSYEIEEDEDDYDTYQNPEDDYDDEDEDEDLDDEDDEDDYDDEDDFEDY